MKNEILIGNSVVNFILDMKKKSNFDSILKEQTLL